MVQHLSETPGNHIDSTSHNNDGAVSATGVNQGVDGFIGGGDDFNGGHVTLPRVCTGETQFTFSAWIYARLNARYIISQWNNNQGAFLLVTGSQVQLYVNGIHVDVSTSLNAWHYVVGTFDGTTARLWIKGVSDSSSGASNPIWPNESMSVGDRSTHDRKFYGLIDEVRCQILL